MWQLQFLCPIYKNKGSDTDPSNYRGLSLGCIFSKIFLSIICSRIDSYSILQDIIVPEQGGYRKNRGTIENIFILWCQVKKALSRKNGHLYCLFIDYSKCFDLINRDLLWYKLISIGLSRNTIMLLRVSIAKLTCASRSLVK